MHALWITLRIQRTFSLRIVNPDGRYFDSDRSDQRAAIRGQGDAILLTGAVGDLLGISAGKTLPPYMMSAPYFGREIHPLSIGRPCRRPAVPVRTNLPARRTAIHWDHAARMPHWIHFHH